MLPRRGGLVGRTMRAHIVSSIHIHPVNTTWRPPKLYSRHHTPAPCTPTLVTHRPMCTMSVRPVPPTIQAPLRWSRSLCSDNADTHDSCNIIPLVRSADTTCAYIVCNLTIRKHPVIAQAHDFPDLHRAMTLYTMQSHCNIHTL